MEDNNLDVTRPACYFVFALDRFCYNSVRSGAWALVSSIGMIVYIMWSIRGAVV